MFFKKSLFLHNDAVTTLNSQEGSKNPLGIFQFGEISHNTIDDVCVFHSLTMTKAMKEKESLLRGTRKDSFFPFLSSAPWIVHYNNGIYTNTQFLDDRFNPIINELIIEFFIQLRIRV